MSIITKFKENNKLALSLNLVVIGIVGFLLLLAFFFLYLPAATHHGETLSVPNVIGKMENEAANILEAEKLRYEVIDSTYDADLPPLAVVSQHPRQGEQVKTNRKIYLTTNYATPPSLQLPKKLIEQSLKNAEEQLSILGLKIGEVTTAPYKFKDVVVGIYVKGKKLSKEDLAKGYLVKTGEVVDIMVGDGEGRATSVEEMEERMQNDAGE